MILVNKLSILEVTEMNKLRDMRLLAASVALLVVSALPVHIAHGQDSVKIGFLGGFTGPIEGFTPGIFQGSESAVEHINSNGGVLGGRQIEIVTGDSACEPTAAANAADRLVNTENVSAIVGPNCSGATISAANNASIPGGVVIVSPSATSPAISTMDDNDLVFRSVPSDAYQGQSMAKLLLSKGIDNVAITYINNDYGKGFADAVASSFSSMGGTISASEAHEEGKADYRAEIGSLAGSGAEFLVVLAYANGSGQTIIRQALESGDFTRFAGGDGMPEQSLIDGIGAEELEGMIITRAGSPEGKGKDNFAMMWKEAGYDDSAYSPHAYDAAFMLALAIESKGNDDREGMVEALRSVSSPPGEMVYPGEWAKAMSILAGGGEVNYEGAAGNQDFDENGDVAGLIVEVNVQNGELVEVGPIM